MRSPLAADLADTLAEFTVRARARMVETRAMALECRTLAARTRETIARSQRALAGDRDPVDVRWAAAVAPDPGLGKSRRRPK